MPFVEFFQAVVSIAVSVVPEGLPALITITLAIGVQRMAKPNCHHPPPPGSRDSSFLLYQLRIVREQGDATHDQQAFRARHSCAA
jgi:hypothetical protein